MPCFRFGAAVRSRRLMASPGKASSMQGGPGQKCRRPYFRSVAMSPAGARAAKLSFAKDTHLVEPWTCAAILPSNWLRIRRAGWGPEQK
jgi:hypothetical protein